MLDNSFSLPVQRHHSTICFISLSQLFFSIQILILHPHHCTFSFKLGLSKLIFLQRHTIASIEIYLVPNSIEAHEDLMSSTDSRLPQGEINCEVLCDQQITSWGLDESSRHTWPTKKTVITKKWKKNESFMQNNKFNILLSRLCLKLKSVVKENPMLHQISFEKIGFNVFEIV